MIAYLSHPERSAAGEETVQAENQYNRIASIMKSRCVGKPSKSHYVSGEDVDMGLPRGHDEVGCLDKGGTTVALQVYKDKSGKSILRRIEFDYFQEYKKKPFATLSDAILAFTSALHISPDVLAPSLAQLEAAIANQKPPSPGNADEDGPTIHAEIGNVTVDAYLNDGYQEDGYAHGVWVYKLDIQPEQEGASDSAADEKTDGEEPSVPKIHRSVVRFTHLGLSEKGFIAKMHAQPDVAGPIPPDADGIALTQLHWGATYGIGNSALKSALARGMADAWFFKGRLVNYKIYLGGYNSYAPINISKVKKLKDVADWIDEGPTRVGECFEELQNFTITRYKWRFSDVGLQAQGTT